MTELEFKTQLKELNEAFNNFYTPNRTRHIWSVVKDLPAEYFKRKIGKAIWVKSPPIIDWFIEIANKHNDFSRLPNSEHEDVSEERQREIRLMIDRALRGKGL